jgi:hypothetical protein
MVAAGTPGVFPATVSQLPGRTGAIQVAPEVTWPEPELGDGGLAGLSPLDPVDVPELPELVEPADDDFDDELDARPEVDAGCAVEDACAEPASVAAIPPAARTPVRPAVAVSVRIRCW